jgi:hypothetical protein
LYEEVVTVGAVPLDPQARQIVDAMAATFPPVDFTRSGTENRRLIKEAAAKVIPDAPEPVGEVYDRTVPGAAGAIPVRVYRPLGADESPLPVVAFFHGGGWVVCDLDSHDGMCRAIANASGCVVVAVDPNIRFPLVPTTRTRSLDGSVSTPPTSAATRRASPSPATAPAATWPPSSRSWRATAADRRSRCRCSSTP